MFFCCGIKHQHGSKRKQTLGQLHQKSSFDTRERYQHNGNRANMQIKQLHRQNAHEEGQKKEHTTLAQHS